jgi:hypothetical protein
MSCGNEKDSASNCHTALALTNPNLVSVLHHANNHILIFKDNYNFKGSVMKKAWTIEEENKLDESVKQRMIILKRGFVD